MKHVWILGPLICLACDDSGGGGGSGVRGSILLSDVTKAQARAICSTLVTYDYDKYPVRASCTEEAVYETEDATECKAYVDVCVEEQTRNFEADRQEDLEDCEEKSDQDDLQDLPTNCDYTVAQYEQCNRESIDAYVNALRKASCLDAGEFKDDEDYLESDELSEACQELFAACDL